MGPVVSPALVAGLALVVASYLVVLQIPTLDLLVFSTWEQVRAASADGHAAHGADVSREGQFQFPTEQVPDLSRWGNSFFSKMRQPILLKSVAEILERIWRSVLKICINTLQQWTLWTCLYLHQIQRWTSPPKLTLMVLSADPVTNHWLPGSTAMDLTHPRWPLMTCHRKHNTVRNRIRAQFAVISLNIFVKKQTKQKTESKAEAGWSTWTHPGQFPRSMPLGFGHGRRFPHQRGVSSAASLHEWLKWRR